jgi:Uma2 family endonuclease
MTLPVPAQRFTPQEYLRLEAAAEVKHEFHRGEILAMSGGTYRYSRVTANLITVLGIQLRGSPCFPLEGNMRVRLATEDRYVYPDASVVCGEPKFDALDANQTTIINPKVVVEVLSESTEGYDRGPKFTAYRDLESLDEYVLVSQDRPLIETFLRQRDGTWSFAAWQGIEAVASLRSLGVQLPLAELYTGLTFGGEAGTNAAGE